MMSVDFRKNANILAAIYRSAKPKESTPADPYVIEGYELHAPPELVDRLRFLMAYVPDAVLEFAYGIPVLSTPGGRVFASAGGKHCLYLYLPETEKWGRAHEEYGPRWRQGYAWVAGRKSTPEDEEHFASLMRLAYATAISAG